MRHANDSFYKYTLDETYPYSKWSACEYLRGEMVACSFGTTKKESGQRLKKRRKAEKENSNAVLARSE